MGLVDQKESSGQRARRRQARELQCQRLEAAIGKFSSLPADPTGSLLDRLDAVKGALSAPHISLCAESGDLGLWGDSR